MVSRCQRCGRLATKLVVDWRGSWLGIGCGLDISGLQSVDERSLRNKFWVDLDRARSVSSAAGKAGETGVKFSAEGRLHVHPKTADPIPDQEDLAHALLDADPNARSDMARFQHQVIRNLDLVRLELFRMTLETLFHNKI